MLVFDENNNFTFNGNNFIFYKNNNFDGNDFKNKEFDLFVCKT